VGRSADTESVLRKTEGILRKKDIASDNPQTAGLQLREREAQEEGGEVAGVQEGGVRGGGEACVKGKEEEEEERRRGEEEEFEELREYLRRVKLDAYALRLCKVPIWFSLGVLFA
jgi:hypothetical protein